MPDNSCALSRLDPIQLAWAAGLFDGEGTTMAAARTGRPGYFRLEMSVPQCGHGVMPEVLLRFQVAVLGMGNITGPNDDDMYFWPAASFSEVQATVAVLWPHLGLVKRAQAAAAMRTVQRQYDSGAYASRGPRRRRAAHSRHGSPPIPMIPAGELDRAWAAGFLDGEGHFGLPRTVSRKGGSGWRRLRASASQHGSPDRPAEVLTRLQRILGGRIERHGDIDDFRWVVERGPVVDQIFRWICPWLGTVKQEQARAAIDTFQAQTRLHGTSSRCARGHEYDRVYLSRTGPKRRCGSCARIVSRMQRARAGIAPRQFKVISRRYNF